MSFFTTPRVASHDDSWRSAWGSAENVAGFEVESESLGDFLAPVLERPLLPASLGNGEISNEPLFFRVVDPAGAERFTSAGTFYPELSVERDFGDAYGGVLDGFLVQLSIDPKAAPALVIGGLPPSRLPLLAVLIFLTAALSGVAMLQLRRERTLQRMRSEFVASASHELRTPLTQIRMFADTLLLDRVRSPHERRQSLRIIAREATRLSHLVENLLHSSRPPSPSAANSEQVLLADAVRDTLQRFEPLARDRDIRFLSELDSSVAASVDPDGLQQVLLNLLDNAAKYGPRGQEVLVGVEAHRGHARVYIEDGGPGVPKNDRERIFERFFRLDRDRGSEVAGTGVGLSVVRMIVASHGGHAFVEPGEGGGSRFVVELPQSVERRES